MEKEIIQETVDNAGEAIIDTENGEEIYKLGDTKDQLEEKMQQAIKTGKVYKVFVLNLRIMEMGIIEGFMDKEKGEPKGIFSEVNK